MVEKDFSKCQCPKAGWCDLLQKEMTATPPNWQWCQGLTEDERQKYHNKINGKVRTLKKSAKGLVNVVNFVDDIPKPTSDYAVCVIPANDSAMELLDITREGVQSYAEKCGADYIELSGDQCPDWPMANKYRLYSVTSKYKKTLYIDCDVVIKPSSPNIFEETPDDKISVCDDFLIFSSWGEAGWIKEEQDNIVTKLLDRKHDQMKNGAFDLKFCPNAGVMVIPKSCREYYKQPDKPYTRMWCFDQHWLAISAPREVFNIMEERWNNRAVQSRVKKPKSKVPSDFWTLLDDCHFIHINGFQSDPLTRKSLLQNFSQGKFTRYPKKVYPVSYISNKQLLMDTMDFIERLPPIGGVVGVPRSGMFSASVISTSLSVPLYSISNNRLIKLSGFSSNGGSRMCKFSHSSDLPLLVIDDTSHSGEAMRRTKAALKNHKDIDFIHSVIYHEKTTSLLKDQQGDNLLDILNFELPFPHLLEWNIFNTFLTQFIMFDMDGVFCPDCTVEIDADEKLYVEWMRDVNPIKARVPNMYHANAICTGRPEKYRQETEEWLDRHGFKYQNLYMWPDSKEKRDRGGHHSKNVAEFKSSKFKDSKSIVFVESCDIQSRMIAKNTEKYTLSINNGKLYQ